jgi:hypothetical protein
MARNDTALAANVADWLSAILPGIRSLSQLKPDALESALGCGDIDVAWPGDELHRLAPATIRTIDSVGQHGYCLRTANRVHLIDAKQRARGKDGRVRPPIVVALSRRHHCKRSHPSHHRRNNIHDDAAGIDGSSTRHIEPHALDRQPAFGHRATRHDCGHDIHSALIGVHRACTCDRLL